MSVSLDIFIGNIGIVTACLPFIWVLFFWKRMVKSDSSRLIVALMFWYFIYNLSSELACSIFLYFEWYKVAVYFEWGELIIILMMYALKISKQDFWRHLAGALLVSSLLLLGLLQFIEWKWQISFTLLSDVILIWMSIRYMLEIYHTSTATSLLHEPHFVFATAVFAYSGIGVFVDLYDYIFLEQFHHSYVYFIIVFYVFGIAYYSVMNWFVWKIRNC